MQSGLAAYFYSLPGLGLGHTPGILPPQDSMKRFILEHALTRVSASQIGMLDHLDVVYNLARGDPAHEENPCAINFRKRDGESISACTLSKSTSTVAATRSLGYVFPFGLPIAVD